MHSFAKVFTLKRFNLIDYFSYTTYFKGDLLKSVWYASEKRNSMPYRLQKPKAIEALKASSASQVVLGVGS